MITERRIALIIAKKNLKNLVLPWYMAGKYGKTGKMVLSKLSFTQ